MTTKRSAETIRKYVRILGLAFHPDTPPNTYVKPDDSPMFTLAESAELNQALRDCDDDVFTIAFDEWSRMGLKAKGEGYTAGELIEALKRYPPKTPVDFIFCPSASPSRGRPIASVRPVAVNDGGSVGWEDTKPNVIGLFTDP